MKKAACALFCIMVVSYIFSVTAFADDFGERAISAFQKYRTLNEEWTAAFLSGDGDVQGETGKLLTEHENNEFAFVLKSLPEKYCSDPRMDVLQEFMKTLIITANSGAEYPIYVFAELFACDPGGVKKGILSLPSEDQKVIIENLDYGFKNIAYKIESLPNYKDLVKKLDGLKKEVY